MQVEKLIVTLLENRVRLSQLHRELGNLGVERLEGLLESLPIFLAGLAYRGAVRRRLIARLVALFRQELVL